MNCRTEGCTATGFTGPYAVHQHKIEAHGAKPRRRGNRRRAAAETVAADVETKLLADVTELFTNAGTEPHQDARVLTYLNSRFGPEVYASDDAPAAEDAPE